jgi:hypothetical protein
MTVRTKLSIATSIQGAGAGAMIGMGIQYNDMAGLAVGVACVLAVLLQFSCLFALTTPPG